MCVISIIAKPTVRPCHCHTGLPPPILDRSRKCSKRKNDKFVNILDTLAKFTDYFYDTTGTTGPYIRKTRQETLRNTQKASSEH